MLYIYYYVILSKWHAEGSLRYRRLQNDIAIIMLETTLYSMKSCTGVNTIIKTTCSLFLYLLQTNVIPIGLLAFQHSTH